MTVAPAAASSPIRSYEERAVLSKYATGSDLHDIKDARGHDWVAAVVMRVTGMDRGRARAAVLAWDSRMASQGGRREKEAAPPAAKPAKVKPVKQTPPPAPTPAAPELPRELVMPADIEALLKDAEQSGLARLVEKADRIRNHIHDLNGMMANSEKERVLRATIRVLTEQRDKALEELKELTGKTDVRDAGPPLSAKQRAEIRHWAAAQGITVAGNGRLQNRVVDAWREANPS